MISSTVRFGLLGLVALLALAGLGGGVLAAGDLFDDAYRDCPHKTRLRDGQIDDLAVNRDADDEDHVNVSWSATDPATWGLGPNAYSTSLVVILDDQDGDPVAKTLSLGSTKTTFEGIKTGTEVTVQMAIVVDTAEGDYLISDILARSINQSLTAPDFSGSWYRIRVGGGSTPAVSPDVRTKDLFQGTDDDALNQVHQAPDFQYDSAKLANGAMYYIGYNENFANYRPGTTSPAAYAHNPSTPRLRIGLAHPADESDSQRDDVDFDAYIIRIADSDGDVVNEGDDVKTVSYNYGTAATGYTVAGTTPPAQKTADRKLFITDLPNVPEVPTRVPPYDFGTMTTTPALQNVRIVDGSKITVGVHLDGVTRNSTDSRVVTPASLSIVKVGVSARPRTPGTGVGALLLRGEVYANPPDEHRDFPIDTLSSDVTYTITAWAVNEDGEVISPVATLNLRPVDKTVTLADVAGSGFKDYLNPDTTGNGVTSGTLIVTEFTVLK